MAHVGRLQGDVSPAQLQAVPLLVGLRLNQRRQVSGTSRCVIANLRSMRCISMEITTHVVTHGPFRKGTDVLVLCSVARDSLDFSLLSSSTAYAIT